MPPALRIVEGQLQLPFDEEGGKKRVTDQRRYKTKRECNIHWSSEMGEIKEH